ncbi:hypothetical protein FHU41_000595 [Psychromicrobium silvestre]|uniref:Tic20-like protein n=1 Tax=Psychromicrobium silvestre TaxID=1645614 RepID=A0A7Y9LRQ0_9MICC|nr:hypothetical protein [Psychromicrobium silvestre]
MSFPGEDRSRHPERHTQQFQAASAQAQPLTAAEDKQFAFLAHCGGILGCIPALLIYLIFKDRGPFTAQESKEALNFTLPPTILALVANVLALVVPGFGSIFAILAVVIWVFLTVYSVIAAVQVNKGNPFRYPLNLRLIR